MDEVIRAARSVVYGPLNLVAFSGNYLPGGVLRHMWWIRLLVAGTYCLDKPLLRVKNRRFRARTT